LPVRERREVFNRSGTDQATCTGHQQRVLAALSR
jgi:hypothetical protein